MNSPDVFFNRAGRVRSGWRFLIFSLAFAVASGVVVTAIQTLFFRPNANRDFETVQFLSVSNAASFIIAVLLGWCCGKYFEGVPFRALGVSLTRDWLKNLIFGLLFGALTLISAVAVAVACGGLSFNLNQAHGSTAIGLTLAVSLAVFFVGAAFEEALFRGYILQTFARANLAWMAIALTSLFFAAAHLGNENATLFSTLNTALAGIWFSVAYLKTRTLWLPFGLHLMWNWFQGAIFGIEVSGFTSLTTAPLLRETDVGPVWLTGETYGIEGGIACTIAIIISILLIWFLPIFKPTEEMLLLTSQEKSVEPKNLTAK